jgi:hypothetical protein
MCCIGLALNIPANIHLSMTYFLKIYDESVQGVTIGYRCTHTETRCVVNLKCRVKKTFVKIRNPQKTASKVQFPKRSIHFCRTPVNYRYSPKKQTKHYLFSKYYCLFAN